MELILSLLISAVAFYLGAYLLPGVSIKNFVHAIIAAIVVAVLNATLGLLLKILTLGILALLSWVCTAIIILIASKFLKGLVVKNFWWALGLAAIVSITSGILHAIF